MKETVISVRSDNEVNVSPNDDYYLIIKTCQSSNLSQKKFLVIYWDLRGLYFYNTWNWFHSPVIIPLNLTYGTSAYIFKTSFVLFYKHAYILVKHAAIEFFISMCSVSIIYVFYHIFVSNIIFKTRIIKTEHTRTTILNSTLLPSCNY